MFTDPNPYAEIEALRQLVGRLERAQRSSQELFDDLNIGKSFVFRGPARAVPAKHVFENGQSLSRTTYAAAFEALCPIVSSTATATASNDRITTGSAHGLVVGDLVFIDSIGSGGAGLSADTEYFVAAVPTSTTITLGTGRTVTAATGAISVTGGPVNITSDGTNLVLRHAPHGIGAGANRATTFRVPDSREVVDVGKGDMSGGVDSGGAAISGDRGIAGFAWANVLGLQAGEATHTLLSGESGLPAHFHTMANAASSTHTHTSRSPLATRNSDGALGLLAADGSDEASGGGAATRNFMGIGFPAGAVGVSLRTITSSGPSAAAGNSGSVAAADASTGHNNVQPSLMCNKIIYVGV